jgi:hypothetical protein
VPRSQRLAARILAVSALVAAALLGAQRASAYCRTAVCSFEGERVHGKTCTPAEPDDCGIPLQWRKPCVGVTLQEDGSRDVSDGAVHQTVLAAFAAWEKASCGGAGPSIHVDDLGQVTCDRVEYNQHAGNANIVMFRSLVWPHQGEESEGTTDTIALTTVTYDVEKGDIFDADIEVNEAQNHFTTGDGAVDVDLLSVLTHEAGHFLGVAHSSESAATMFPSYDNGSIELRDLDADDVAAICDAYPPERKTTGTCDALPRHGFSPDCDGLQQEGRCSLSPGSPRPAHAPWAIALGLLLIRGARALTKRRARALTTRRARRAP